MNNPYQNFINQTSPQMQMNSNPYQNQYQQIQNQQKYDIIKVNGENGASAFQLPPNSKIFLLDESNKDKVIVWYKETDGAGYPNLTGYELTPIQAQEEKVMNEIEQRLLNIEKEIGELKNDKSIIKPIAEHEHTRYEQPHARNQSVNTTTSRNGTEYERHEQPTNADREDGWRKSSTQNVDEWR